MKNIWSPVVNALLKQGRLFAIICGAFLSFAVQAGPTLSLSALAQMDGANRREILIEGARREGQLTIYTSMTASTAAKVKADFERRYPGIKVNLWRASSEAVLQRTVTEARANRHTFDVLETNGPELEAAHREKLLQQVKSSHFADLIPQALMPHREWVATRLNLFVMCYNTNQVKQSELPKTYSDLLHPRWKGRLAIEAGDSDWLMSAFEKADEASGLNLLRKIVATNGIEVRKGHALLAEMVIAGEIALGMTCYSYKIDQDRKAGAPVDWLSLGPVVARPNGVGVSRNAPHPYAALLFYEYMISEVQEMLQELELVPVSVKVESPLKGREVKFVDAKKALDEQEKWDGLFKEIFVIKRR